MNLIIREMYFLHIVKERRSTSENTVNCFRIITPMGSLIL